MSYPSLNKLYFESLHIPSAPAIWIGCSVALHVGLFLLPLGGSSRQSIAFAPGDAGVQVELVAEESTPAAAEEQVVESKESIVQADPSMVDLASPEDEVVLPEPALVSPPHKVAAAKTRATPLHPESYKPSESSAGSLARAGSAAAQPAAQVYTTQPPYPAGARDLGVEGNVRLRVRVGVDGSPRAVEIARSSGRADFDSNSLSTVKREWRFRPARTVSGVPVESTVTVAVHFTLKS